MKGKAWVEVDLGAIASNVREIKGVLPPRAKLMAVVKADAYGHGAVSVARTVVAAGADYLAVATGDEALELRGAGVDAPILVLNTGLPGGQEEALISHGITQTVSSVQVARSISKKAVNLGIRAPVHLKIDTGMGRLGVNFREVGILATQVRGLPGLYWEGAYSHLAAADEREAPFPAHCWEQFNRFRRAKELMKAGGLTPSLFHIANSAAILRYPAMHLDLVRAGCLLYGFYPVGDDLEREQAALFPALTWKARIEEFCQENGGRILALVPVGFVHGLPAAAESALVAGERAPILKPVAPHHCWVDVTRMPRLKRRMEVVLIGRQGGEEIGINQVAGWGETLPEEVTCRLGSSPRVFIGEGEKFKMSP